MMRAPAGLLAVPLLAACARSPEPAPLAAAARDGNALTAEVFLTNPAIAAAEGQVQTFARTINGERREDVVRVMYRDAADANTWFVVDSRDNFLEFSLSPEDGPGLVLAHNGRRSSFMIPRGTIRLAKPEMIRGETFVTETPLIITRGSDRYTGNGVLTVTFGGYEDITTPLLEVEAAPRLDSHMELELPFGLYLAFDQHQWFSPGHGEVKKELTGTFGVLGASLKNFVFVEELIAAEPAGEDDLAQARETVTAAREALYDRDE